VEPVDPTNQPPVVDAGAALTGGEGTAVAVSGAVSDPDGDPLTALWTWAAGAGVDAGATCVFADPTAAVTTVSCTDDGEFVLTLSGDDGTADPVQDTTTLTLSNADPVVSITAPADMSVFTAGSSVTVSATVTDAGANDTHTCTLDAGAGPIQGTVAAGVCTATVPLTTVGVHDLVLQVTDDDGGTATVELSVVVAEKASKITGGGFVIDGGRTSFGFVAKSTPKNGWQGQLQVNSPAGRFHSSDLASLTTSGKSATWSGTGRWNGVDGYTYTVEVVDAGPAEGKGKGKNATSADIFRIIVRDPAGNVVLDTGGPIGGGEIQVR
jgi:hypothetical protein